MLNGFIFWFEELVEIYWKNGCWVGEMFGDLLRDWVVKYGDCIVIICGNIYWSY